MKNQVRLGVVGVGGMGGSHARHLLAGKVAGCQLTAVCDAVPSALAAFPEVKGFSQAAEMIGSGAIDAILIATPHFSHVPIGLEALRAGLHVLMEKPIAVDKAEAQKLVAAHTDPRQVFAAMFNQRTDPRYVELRRLILSGELGEIRRISWIVSDWFRTEAYYASGSWRATWAGEGGGLLVNQCPHNLDLFQWIFGLPKRVRGFCQVGKYHDIEVEDEVTAYFEYDGGKTGVFISSTGEAPGTNRFEIAAENGRVLVEKDHLDFIRNDKPMTEFSRTSKEGFARPANKSIRIELPAAPDSQHLAILRNFTNAILRGEQLIAPAAEGVHAVELANAIVLSSFREKTISLPMDAAEYAAFLGEKMKTSRFQRRGAAGPKS